MFEFFKKYIFWYWYDDNLNLHKLHILSGESIDGKLISTNKEDARRWKAEELIGKLMRGCT